MPDNLVLLGDFIDNAHKNLQDCWQVWKKSRGRNAVDEAKKCAELVETLARETRIWVFSKLADSRELPDNLTPPSATSAFGKEVAFLERLRDNPSLRDLLGAKPDGSSSGFVRLQKVYELVKAYDEDSDPAAESIKRGFDQLEKSNQQTWLTMVREFVPFRNLDSHRTNQLDSDGAPITVIKDLELVAPLIAQAMRERVPWMMLQAAARFGSYELQSREDVKGDPHQSVYELRKNKAFESTRAGHWYARYDDEHNNLVELFPRLESDAQVQSAVGGTTADSAESALFNSAKTGCFLPLIGPAFGLPDRPDSPGAVEVLRRAWDVVSDDRYEPLKGFLTRVVSDRLNLVDIPDLTPASPKRCEDLRTRLVGELADLASKATMALGRSLSKSGSPLTGKSEILEEEEAVVLSKRIKEVSEVVKALSRTIPEADCIDLGAYAIEQSLRDLNNDEVRDNRLSLNSVSWLDDLVWHALRWDAPLYPDSEALDLQLLLGARRSDNRRGAILGRSPASSGAALVIEPQKLVEYLESWSRRIEKRMRAAVVGAKSRGWKNPYETLAKAMVLCLEMRQRGPVDSELRFEQRRNVFIVDATFDQRMCTALEQGGAMGAVVYPVDIVDTDNNKYPVWAMRRFPRPANADDEYSILWDNCGRTIDWQDVPRIIVLKPFGAPLERADQLEDAQRRAQRELNNLNFPVPEERQKSTVIQRRYLFDDVSILRDMVRRQDSMPPGFRHTIHDYTDRMFELYFLGYAIDEYGRRARIVADVRPEDDDGREKDSRGKPRYVSHPPPNELVFHYLIRAGFADYDTPLPAAMRDLALSLEQSKLEVGKP